MGPLVTCIAYRDGVIASDTGAMIGGTRITHATKIARNTQGDLAGAAGSAVYSAAFLQWFSGGEKGLVPEAKESDDNVDRGAIFRRGGVIEIYEPGGMFTCRGPYYALGSGRHEALGAMFVGANAQQAVEAAIALDSGSFGEIEILAHKESPTPRKTAAHRRKRKRV